MVIAVELAVSGFQHHARPVNYLANCNKKVHI
jgi:hypothetical protein